MANRYHMALARGTEEYEKTVNEDAALLHNFGLRLMSVQGGVTAAVESELKGGRINPWNVLEISTKTWEHLYPLLIELQARRARDEG